jgi:hypothetical protein
MAFVTICLAPDRWKHNILSALCCWAACYGTANGLPGFFCCAFIAQITSVKPRRMNRFSVFWILNIFLLLLVYLPGLAMSNSPRHPSIPEMLRFFVIYLGLPVAGLIRYPYVSMFQSPDPSLFGELVGIAMCVLAACLAWIFRESVRSKSFHSLLFVSFGTYALASSSLTAWGRAALPPYGVGWANSSRYSMYGAYLIYGILFLLAVDPKPPSLQSADRGVWRAVKAMAPVLFIVAIGLAAWSYTKSVPVYHEAHEFNRLLEAAFEDSSGDYDSRIYPSPEVAAQLKRDLRALRLGPYRYSREEPDPDYHLLKRDTSVPPAQMQMPAGPLSPGVSYAQSFVAHHENLTRIEVEFATYSSRIAAGILKMHLRQALKGDDIASSTIQMNTIQDNSFVGFTFPAMADSREKTYYIVFEAQGQNQPITVWLSASDVYPNGSFFVNGEAKAQDTCFRTFYKSTQ